MMLHSHRGETSELPSLSADGLFTSLAPLINGAGCTLLSLMDGTPALPSALSAG